MAERDAFESFYREHYPRVVRACYLVLLDHARAEDVASEAFSTVWARWRHIESDDHAGGYVFKTAMRLCARAAARRRREVTGAPVDRPVDDAFSPAMRLDILSALATLPLRQREAVVLRDWAGFETKRVAAMLGTSTSTVRVHLARGRAALRPLLTPEIER